jgi:pyridoxamine 5'-phosphate oxidase
VITVPPAALEVLHAWLPADEEPVRPTMQLATVDEDGRPDVRTVLLSSWDAGGFAFHTDRASRKHAQLAARPHAAAAVLLVGRQLVVRGRVEPQAEEAAAEAYGARTPYLRRLAWLNTAELAQRSDDDRRRTWLEDGRARPDEGLQPSPTWAGWVIRPDRLTFWSADPDGPSHRVEHRLTGGTWTVHHLPG